MKICKLKNKLKKIFILIMCLITLTFVVPVKSNAGIIEGFVDLALNIPDWAMFGLNALLGDGKTKSYIAVNYKGADANRGTNGRIYNFDVTPADIFRAGMKEKVKYYNEGNLVEEEKTIIPLLDANFFDRSTGEENNSADILRPVISGIYNSLTGLAIITMMVVLLYIGIRIIISSAATEQSKYKQLLMDWVIGLCLVFCMHFIMSFIMSINQLIINTLGNTKVDNYYISLPNLEGDDAIVFSFYKNWNDIIENKNTKVANFAAEKLDYNDGFSKFQIDENGMVNTNKFGQVHINARIYKVPGVINRIFLTEDEWADVVIYRCNIVEYLRTCITVDTDYVTYLKYKGNNVEAQYDGEAAYKEDQSQDDENQDDDEKQYTATFWAYAIMYTTIAFQTVTFAVKYINRVIKLAFLTMIAPLIAIMYPMDKIGDSKAQTFNMWFKEYLFNSLLQPLHLLLYTIFIVGAAELAKNHCIYAIGFYAFIVSAEGFFKKMFGFDKADLPKGLGGQMLDMKIIDAITGLGPPGSLGNKKDDKGGIIGGGFKRAKFKPLDNSQSNVARVANSGGSGSNGAGGSGVLPSDSGGSGSNGAGGSGVLPSGSGGFSSNGASSVRMPRNSRLSDGLGVAKHVFTDPVARFTRRITGGATSNLGTALKGHKKEMALNMALGAGKRIGKTAVKTGTRIVGAGIGAMAGLAVGAIGMGVTGDPNALGNGLKAGILAGANRAGSVQNFVGKRIEEAEMGYKAENYVYAAAKNREEWIEKNSNFLNMQDEETQNQLQESLGVMSLMTDVNTNDPKELLAFNNAYQASPKDEHSLKQIMEDLTSAKTIDISDPNKKAVLRDELFSQESSKIADSQISQQELSDAKTEAMADALKTKQDLINAANGNPDLIKVANDNFDKTTDKINNDPSYTMDIAKRHKVEGTVNDRMAQITNMYKTLNS